MGVTCSRIHPPASSKSTKRTPPADISPPPHSPCPPLNSASAPPRGGDPPCFARNSEDPIELLRKYDTVILLDDSGSMHGLKWEEARQALSALADLAGQYDTDGIELHFLNNEAQFGHNLRTGAQVDQIFRHVQPGGMTPIGDRLEILMREYLGTIEKADDQGRLQSIKPINYLVITDGCASDDPESVIVAAARRLDEWHFPLNQLGIQFVQIGNDAAARRFLADLDDGLTNRHNIRDIVDTTPCTAIEGKISSEILTKALLGGINRRVDRTRAEDIVP